ncbi:MAG: hypothetical protein HFJ60_01245 [Clostridia bacterium]|nr:hypothetical protein [Clostridia bacterium]
MNIIIILGKIISDIEFKFIIKNKNKSISIFELELTNNSIVTVKAYNILADYCYSELNKEDIILIEGQLNSKLEIISKTIEKVE